MVFWPYIHNAFEKVIIAEIDAIRLVKNPLRRLMRQKNIRVGWDAAKQLWQVPVKVVL